MKPLPEQDKLARRYLLGRLPEAEREEIGEHLFSDDAFYEIVQAVEMDLRDAYARNELSGRDRDDFETHLLRTERQRKASRVSSVLAKSLPKPPAARRRRTHWVFAAAAAIAIPALFYSAYLHRQMRMLQPQPSVSRTQPASQAMPAVVSLFLPGIVLRGADELPRLNLPQPDAIAKLEIEVTQPGPFLATLADSAGNEVFRQSGLRSIDGAVTVWISAAALPAGIFELRLMGAGVEEKRRLQVNR